MKFGDELLNVRPGQQYLSTQLSAEYMADKSKIKAGEVTIGPLTGRQANDEYVVADGHHRFVWSAYHNLSLSATRKKNVFGRENWGGMKYQVDPNKARHKTLNEVARSFNLTEKAKLEATNLPRSRQLPPLPEVKSQLPETKSQPFSTGNIPTMGRVIVPRSWDKDIKPHLGEYGAFDEEQTKQLQQQFIKRPQIRGIPDLIEMTFHNLALNKKVQNAVKQSLTKTAPDLDTWRKTGHTTVTCGRADTRMPHVIREQGGFFGWDSGMVSGPHARTYIREIMLWSPKDQAKWINQWKWPTPHKDEANPWVASGVGAKGGQKGGGEYKFDLPLIFHENLSGGEMIIATDTGNIDNASVIGVRLGGMRGDEIIMLTGIPWKYVTEWYGSLGGKSIATYDANKAADKCENLTKSKN